MPLPEPQPKEWVDALGALLLIMPWAAGVLGTVFVVRYAIVPLIRAWRGRND